ncbi:MAG: hypothetical protein H7645_09730 [Candidatus Heimdallarchaeota archaeon]|nr:hypothetical protein [Candidatus Heimdallarchaeota archaeon]MCK4770607.1 hypothetical protein [Candidatus Heimdallarchaeota archaeon]
MDDSKEKAKRWIEKLKITTDLFLKLPADTKLPNGWGKREIGIHLQGWDEEMIKIAEPLKQGKAFIWEDFCADPPDSYNAKFLERSKGKSLEEVLTSFEQTRATIIKVYEDLLDNHFQEDKKHTDYFSLWWHDVHHLKLAGIDVDDLME